MCELCANGKGSRRDNRKRKRKRTVGGRAEGRKQGRGERRVGELRDASLGCLFFLLLARVFFVMLDK